MDIVQELRLVPIQLFVLLVFKVQMVHVYGLQILQVLVHVIHTLHARVYHGIQIQNVKLFHQIVLQMEQIV